MQIPMIFFTIIIQRKKKSVQSSIEEYYQKKAMKEFDERRLDQMAQCYLGISTTKF